MLTAGAAPQVARVGAGEIRSVSDLGFGAVAAVDTLRLGAVDREGVISAVQTLELKGQIGVLLVVGTEKAGAVLYARRRADDLPRRDAAGWPTRPARTSRSRRSCRRSIR